MNTKGSMALGGILLLFLGLIVAFAMLPAIGDGVSILKDTRTAVNVSSGALTLNTAAPVVGQELIGTATVLNTTNNVVITANVTVDEGLCATDGGKSVCVTLTGDGTFAGENLTGDALRVSYTYGADGYAEEAGTRGIANLIMIASALAILGFAVAYGVKNFA